MGPQTGAEVPGDYSPSQSRAQSEGQLDRGSTGMTASSAASGQQRGGSSALESRGHGGPRGWRPAGLGRLPLAPDPPVRSAQLASAPLEGLPPTGSHSEARAASRTAARREALAAFSSQGPLGQLREDGEQQRHEAPAAVTGPPLHGDRRAAERRAAKEARVQQLLEERAQRLAAEAHAAAASKALRRGAAASMSAPALPSPHSFDPEAAARQRREEAEKQKLRLACKMEILDFFNGYSKSIGKVTAEQTRMLLAKLHGGSEVDALSCEQPAEGEGELGVEETPQEFAGGLQAEEQQSVQQRLQQVNDMCNKVFEETDADIAL